MSDTMSDVVIIDGKYAEDTVYWVPVNEGKDESVSYLRFTIAKGVPLDKAKEGLTEAIEQSCHLTLKEFAEHFGFEELLDDTA